MSDLIDRAIGGTTLEESVKALQDVFIDHDLAEKGEPMIDLIDRQKAIDALIDALAWTWSGMWSEKAAIDAIKNLPSAEPEIIKCKDCKYMTEHYDTNGNAPYWTCYEWGSETDYDGFCHYAERRTDATFN